MNWPSLSPECSRAIADVLKDVVQSKPKDLFDFTAKRLQAQSGMDPEAFERYFEECKRKPRTYVLEDRCPRGVEPLTWVPMRYNDETILSIIRTRLRELGSDIMHKEPIQDTQSMLDRMVVSVPEIMYLRDSPEELLAFQTMRAIYLSFSGSSTVLQQQSDDPDAPLCFNCHSLLEVARGELAHTKQIFEAVSKSDAMLEALIVCCMLRVVGTHAGFQRRYGGGTTKQDQAILHAVQHSPECLPSIQRLEEPYKQIVLGVLQVHFTLANLISSECVPANFMRLKEHLGAIEGGLSFFIAVTTVEHMVGCRSLLVAPEGVDLVRLATQCIGAIDKYNAPRAYELFLKKRAERHQWRLVKDDFMYRAIARICCFAGNDDTQAWGDMLHAVESLPDHDKEVLKRELGLKDGLTESPVYFLVGAGGFMSQACMNPELTAFPALRLLSRILEDAARTYDRLLNHRIVTLHMEGFGPRARDYRSGGVPFEDTPYVLEELDPGEAMVRIAG